jgi:hypothetical protein
MKAATWSKLCRGTCRPGREPSRPLLPQPAGQRNGPAASVSTGHPPGRHPEILVTKRHPRRLARQRRRLQDSRRTQPRPGRHRSRRAPLAAPRPLVLALDPTGPGDEAAERLTPPPPEAGVVPRCRSSTATERCPRRRQRLAPRNRGRRPSCNREKPPRTLEHRLETGRHGCCPTRLAGRSGAQAAPGSSTTQKAAREPRTHDESGGGVFQTVAQRPSP